MTTFGITQLDFSIQALVYNHTEPYSYKSTLQYDTAPYANGLHREDLYLWKK